MSEQHQSPANDVQDPAEPKEVDTAVETTPQPEPADTQDEQADQPQSANTDVSTNAAGVSSGLGAVPTARERLRAEESQDQESDDN